MMRRREEEEDSWSKAMPVRHNKCCTKWQLNGPRRHGRSLCLRCRLRECKNNCLKHVGVGVGPLRAERSPSGARKGVRGHAK